MAWPYEASRISKRIAAWSSGGLDLVAHPVGRLGMVPSGCGIGVAPRDAPLLAIWMADTVSHQVRGYHVVRDIALTLSALAWVGLDVVALPLRIREGRA